MLPSAVVGNPLTLPVAALALADSIPDALLAADAEGRILLFNRAAERLFGYAAKAVVGQHLRLVAASPAELARLTSTIEAALAKDAAQTVEVGQRRLDGSTLPTSMLVSPWREGPTRCVTLVARALGTPLKASDELFALAFRNGPLAMAIMRVSDLRFVEVNDSFLAASGYAREELIGHTARELSLYATPDEQPALLAKLGRVGALSPLEFVARNKAGVLRVVQKATAEFTVGGEKHSLSMVLDVTEHTQAEEALRKLSRAVEQSPASIVITDRDGLIEYANPRFAQVTGYSIDEVRGQTPRIFKSGETSPDEYAALWRAISTGQEWRGEFHNRKKNGELYWESASISPVFDPGGVITHYVAVKEDISETKRLQRELLQAQKMKAFAQLAAGIAHDFNNLLTVIQGNLSVVNAGDLSEDQAEAIGDVGRAANRAAELTKQLLTFSRRRAPTLAAVDLSELVRDLVKTLERILGDQVEVLVSSSPEARVLADRSLIEQVLVNLTLNARDAMPRGGRFIVTIEPLRVEMEHVRKSPRARQGDFVMLTVADTGVGIAPAVLTRLFEPFFTTKELGKGSGLGLATVLGIVEQHQGWVTVDSEEGKGTSVHVFVPRAEVREETKRPSGSLVLEPKGAGVILVAEDEPEVRAMVARTLSQAGFEVREAASAAEAYAIWEKEIERVVLLVADVVMPGGASGRELAERMKRRKPALQVLYVSGYTDEAMREELGSNALFLEKPFTPAELLRRVRLHLPTMNRLY